MIFSNLLFAFFIENKNPFRYNCKCESQIYTGKDLIVMSEDISLCYTQNYIGEESENQEIFLEDKSQSGRERPWNFKKEYNMYLAQSYERLGWDKKSKRVADCGDLLEFKRYDGDVLKLYRANFCKDRLCPMCAWRRSLKIFSQVSAIMNAMVERYDYRFIFLTLTCRNVEGHELESTIKHLMTSFKRLSNRPQFKLAVKGFFRALEVTHDIEPLITKQMYRRKGMAKYYKKLGLKVGDVNPNFDKFHPHYHVILAVNPTYFDDSKQYMSKNLMIDMWKQSLGVDYDPTVNMKVFKTASVAQTTKSVAEASKYTAKETEFILEDDIVMTDDTVEVLAKALAHKRLTAFGGVFKQLHAELNLCDAEEDDDLVNISEDGEEIANEQLAQMVEIYFWNIGYRQYQLDRIIPLIE